MTQLTYTNPVYDGYFADPFVLKVGDEWWAYGTGPAADDGRRFPVLHSTDFVTWNPVGGALEPLPGMTDYWAPEVAHVGGKFYLYYSAAGGEGDEMHRLRVAVSDHPAGPFVDTGNLLLPNEGFTIDAHPFLDPQTNRWYLFFAKDFFDERVGTALAAVPLAENMTQIDGEPVTILRPSDDWQIHARDRTIYEKTYDAWHTVEGPFVLFHKNQYWLLYSGGAWTGPDYGVGVAVSDSVLGPYFEPESGPVVLRGVQNRVPGPGHNSVTPGPNGLPFVAYHAWDLAQTARRLCLDPLVWTPGGPRCAGPTYTPQTIEVGKVQ